MYFHFVSFLNIEMAQPDEILPDGRQGCNCNTVDIMAGDDLATQGARASPAMLLTLFPPQQG